MTAILLTSAKLRAIKVRLWEHLAISVQRVKVDEDSAMNKNNYLFYDHSSDSNNFLISPSKNNEYKITSMESFLINRDYLLWMETSSHCLWNFLMNRGKLLSHDNT